MHKRQEYQIVNMAKLAELLPKGGRVTIEDLIAKHTVCDNTPAGVLGSGELTVKLEVEVNAQSASATEKIQAAGGTISAR